MPYKCCAPGCRGNYTNGPKVHVFGFPNDSELRQKWLCSIPRDDLVLSKNTKVCEHHFPAGSIIWTISEQDPKTGNIITVNLKKPRLKENVVPTIFPNCPDYFSKNIPVRKSRDEKCKELDELHLFQALEQSKKEFNIHKEATCFENFDGFLQLFKNFNVKSGWFSVINSDNLTLFKFEYTPGPVITWAIVIYDNLKLETYLYGQSVCISIINSKSPFIISTLDELGNVIDAIDDTMMSVPLSPSLSPNTESSIDPSSSISSSKVDPESNSYQSKHQPDSDNTKKILKFVINILSNLKGSDEQTQNLKFISEQLTLLSSSKERYRYSPSTMVLCSILFTISPHSYKYLRNHAPIILPHPDTVKNICNTFLTDPHIDERKFFLTYARNIFQYLTDKEKNIILLFDEIHIDPYLDYKGGNTVGTAVNNNTVASSAVTFMITSPCSSLKEVIHICPVSTLNSEMLYQFIKSIIENLEEIGYLVFCTISDNNAINSKAMSNFSPFNKLSIVFPHPIDPARPLFYLFDTVHILKCIFNNWLNSKPDQALWYPDFNTGKKNVLYFLQ